MASCDLKERVPNKTCDFKPRQTVCQSFPTGNFAENQPDDFCIYDKRTFKEKLKSAVGKNCFASEATIAV
ncbi:hypothetical protein CGZ80_20010 [Rhodopirellula sp. MGV]|nr:hypothetical protein CGZ80_20010 [Rhodopirellula sp. MGV]